MVLWIIQRQEKLTLDMVIDKLWNEEPRRKCIEVVPPESDALISEKRNKGDREAKEKIIVSRIMTLLEEDLSPRGKMSRAFIVRK